MAAKGRSKRVRIGMVGAHRNRRPYRLESRMRSGIQGFRGDWQGKAMEGVGGWRRGTMQPGLRPAPVPAGR